MGIKRLEDFNHDVEVEKKVLSSMPINNAKNLATYKAKVTELKEEYSAYRDTLFKEIQRRASKYLNLQENERTALVRKELLDYQDLGLFNPINTPFEKMGFDTLLYSLTHYYKNDLESVNKDIEEAFAKFQLVGITLTENDFVYSNYARKYIKELLKDNEIERMKDVFEDLHWKCPDVISHIETSFRILFDKNIKAFENYIENKKREIIIDNLTYDDYILKRNSLSKELYDLEHYDQNVIVNAFLNGELMLNDYNVVNVSRSYSKFIGENPDINKGKEKIDDFKNLSYSLDEYNNYLKFSYVLDDVKKKYAERDKHLEDTGRIKKEINGIIGELTRLTDEINNGSLKGFWIFKKKVDVEKNYLEINEKVKALDAKYAEYDEALIYEKMNSCLADTSSIYDVFKFVFAFKGYLRSCIKAKDEEVDINKVKQIVKEFDKFLQDPNLNILKNITFTVDTDIAMVLVDHYKLLEISVSPDSLNKDGIEEMQKYLKVIINDYYLGNAGLSIDFIMDLFESKKLIEQYK